MSQKDLLKKNQNISPAGNEEKSFGNLFKMLQEHMKKVKNTVNQTEIDGKISEVRYKVENLIVFENLSNNSMKHNENIRNIRK